MTKMNIKIILFFILFVLGSPSFAIANSAPVVSPFVNGDLVPDLATSIVVQKEQLEFDVLIEGDARISVNYQFWNPEKQEVDHWLAFPYHQIGEKGPPVKVSINGIELPSNQMQVLSEEDQVQKFLGKLQSDQLLFVDPVTGETQPNQEHYDIMVRSHAIIFPVVFPSEAVTNVTIEYEQAPGWNKKKYIQPIQLYQYNLLPAKAWKEFHDLTIRIRVPESVYFASNLSLKKIETSNGEALWEGKFPTLPEDNLAFSLMSSEGLVAGIVEPSFYDGVGWILFLIVITADSYLIYRLCLRFKTWAFWLAGVPLASVLGFFIGLLTYAVLIFLIPVLSNGQWFSSLGVVLMVIFAVIWSPLVYILLGIIRFLRKRRKEFNM